MQISVAVDDLFEDKAQLARIQLEAAFGHREIEASIAALPAGSRVLEIGSGTGYLLARLAAAHPDLSFSGIEPVGVGFQEFDAVLQRLEAALPNLVLHRAKIEDFTAPQGDPGADLIFSVNVFEHLEDWRQGVDRAVSLLAPGGQAIVLCPNYAVPYEPHFAIPIVFTPGLTRHLFARRIETVEATLEAEGLWSSLNFITVPALKAHAVHKGYGVAFDREIMARMLARLDEDPEFAKRQKFLAPVARILGRLGLAKLPPTLSPYLKAVLTRC